MAYKIVSVDNHIRTGKLYAVSHFWLPGADPNADPPHQIQDFKLDIYSTERRRKQNARGDSWEKIDGTFITFDDFFALSPPVRQALRFKRESVPKDAEAWMLELIETYWTKESVGVQRSGDLCDKSIVTDSTDSRNILTATRNSRNVIKNFLD